MFFYIFCIISQKKVTFFFNFQFSIFSKIWSFTFFQKFPSFWAHMEPVMRVLWIWFKVRCKPYTLKKINPTFFGQTRWFYSLRSNFFDFFAFFYRFFRYFSIFSLFSEISVTLSSDRASCACAMNLVDGALQTPKPP